MIFGVLATIKAKLPSAFILENVDNALSFVDVIEYIITLLRGIVNSSGTPFYEVHYQVHPGTRRHRFKQLNTLGVPCQKASGEKQTPLLEWLWKSSPEARSFAIVVGSLRIIQQSKLKNKQSACAMSP